MKRASRLWSAALVLCLVSAGASLGRAQGQFAELAKTVPDSANAVAIVNMEALLASPPALAGGWAAKRNAAYASGVSFLPPDAKRAILSMQMDLDLWIPLWESAAIEVDHDPDMPRIAEMSGGSPDIIQGVPVVQLPSDAYVAKFAQRVGAFMAPANRQAATRWIQNVKRKSQPDLSGYLSEALDFADKNGTPVIVALDLSHAWSPLEIRTKLLQSRELIERFQLDQEKIVKTLSGLRGITLGVTFVKEPFGKVKIDFEEELSTTPEIAKAAMLHVFTSHGVLLDEFESWTPKVEGKSMSLEGVLTESGLKRISSLFNRPPALRPLDPNYTPQAKSKEELTKEASLAYFHQVEDLLKDLKKSRASSSFSSLGALGVWLNKYASKIDQISVLNVDPELVDYGANVADAFRGAYDALRNGAARSRIREVNTPMQYNYYSYSNTYGYTYRDRWYGSGLVPYGESGTYAVPDAQAYARERSRARTEENVQSSAEARNSLQGVEKATGDIRRKMTQKYSVDF